MPGMEVSGAQTGPILAIFCARQRVNVEPRAAAKPLMWFVGVCVGDSSALRIRAPHSLQLTSLDSPPGRRGRA